MRSGPRRGGIGDDGAAKDGFARVVVRLFPIVMPPVLAVCAGVAVPVRADDRLPDRERPGTAEAMADDRVPSGSPLVDARREFRRRHGRVTTRVPTAPAAMAAAESLLQESAGEPVAAMRWVLLDEARKLGIAAGSAALVGRSIRIASAEFDFDELGLEILSLREIPLRALPRSKASELAAAAEALATRAESDGRDHVALDALALAVRAWQAAGDDAKARIAAERHDRGVAPLDARSGGGMRPGPGDDSDPFHRRRKGPR